MLSIVNSNETLQEANIMEALCSWAVNFKGEST